MGFRRITERRDHRGGSQEKVWTEKTVMRTKTFTAATLSVFASLLVAACLRANRGKRHRGYRA